MENGLKTRLGLAGRVARLAEGESFPPLLDGERALWDGEYRAQAKELLRRATLSALSPKPRDSGMRGNLS